MLLFYFSDTPVLTVKATVPSDSSAKFAYSIKSDYFAINKDSVTVSFLSFLCGESDGG